MSDRQTAVILRSHNDMPLISHTLAMLARQNLPFHLIALDNESTDGTLDEIPIMSSPSPQGPTSRGLS